MELIAIALSFLLLVFALSLWLDYAKYRRLRKRLAPYMRKADLHNPPQRRRGERDYKPR